MKIKLGLMARFFGINILWFLWRNGEKWHFNLNLSENRIFHEIRLSPERAYILPL